MAQPALITTYGSFATDLVTRERYRRRYDGLDDGFVSLVNNKSDRYTPNALYNGLLIKEDDVERNGQVWEHNLSLTGVVGAKSERRLGRRVNSILEGFDTGQEIYLTRNKNKVVPGSRLSGYPNMICTAAIAEELDDPSWYRLSADFTGLARSKPVKRVIGSNVEIVQRDNLIVLFSGGWSEAKRGQILWPKVTLTFTYWTSYIPTKYLPEQGGIMPGSSVPVITYSFSTNDDTTWHWPNGWRCTNFNPNAINGTTVCETTEVWEWQQQVTF